MEETKKKTKQLIQHCDKKLKWSMQPLAKPKFLVSMCESLRDWHWSSKQFKVKKVNVTKN